MDFSLLHLTNLWAQCYAAAKSWTPRVQPNQIMPAQWLRTLHELLDPVWTKASGLWSQTPSANCHLEADLCPLARRCHQTEMMLSLRVPRSSLGENSKDVEQSHVFVCF